jgi:hypothetical protein
LTSRRSTRNDQCLDQCSSGVNRGSEACWTGTDYDYVVI